MDFSFYFNNLYVVITAQRVKVWLAADPMCIMGGHNMAPG